MNSKSFVSFKYNVKRWDLNQMVNYYANRPTATTPSIPENPTALSVEAPVLTEFYKHRKALLIADAEEGWAAALRRYLSTFQLDVEKDTDLVEWWQVSNYIANFTYLSLRFVYDFLE